MKKTIVSTILICLLLNMISISIAGYDEKPSIPFANIYVDDDNTQGPWDGTYEHPYQFIQDGINNADDSDIVYVFNGIYNENVIIDKSITLFGESNESTIISDRIIIEKNYVTFSRFKISYIEGYGIHLNGDYNTIKNNIITTISPDYYGFSYGICLDGDYNIIKNNIIRDINNNAENGKIYGLFSYGNFNSIKNNIIKNIAHEGYLGKIYGIDSIGNYNNIKNNIISYLNSELGLSLGLYCMDNYNIIEENTIKNINSGLGWATGISLLESSNSKILGNSIDKSNVGIEIAGSIIYPAQTLVPTDNISICNNRICKCRIGWDDYWYGGIILTDSTNCYISNNIFKSNTRDAYFTFDHILSENESYEMYEIPEYFNVSMINSNTWYKNYWGRPRVLPKVINGELCVFDHWPEDWWNDYLYKVRLTNTDLNPLSNLYISSQSTQDQSVPSSIPSGSPTNS